MTNSIELTNNSLTIGIPTWADYITKVTYIINAYLGQTDMCSSEKTTREITNVFFREEAMQKLLIANDDSYTEETDFFDISYTDDQLNEDIKESLVEAKNKCTEGSQKQCELVSDVEHLINNFYQEKPVQYLLKSYDDHYKYVMNFGKKNSTILIEHTLNTLNTIASRCIVRLEDFKHNKPEDSLPIRVLDGMLYPYFTQELKTVVLGGITGTIRSLKFYIGTYEFDTNIQELSIDGPREANFKPVRSFKINTIRGKLSEDFNDYLLNFPEVAHKAMDYSNPQPIVIPLHEKRGERLFDAISIMSPESLNKIDPLFSYLQLNPIDENMPELFKGSLDSTSYYYPDSIRVAFKTTKEEYRCTSKVIKKYVDHNHLEEVFPFGLDDDSSIELLNYLANPMEELAHSFDKKELSSSIPYFIEIKMDSQIGANLLKNFDSLTKFKANKHTLEITVDSSSSPATLAHLKDVIGDTAKSLISKESDLDANDKFEIYRDCSGFLDFVGIIPADPSEAHQEL